MFNSFGIVGTAVGTCIMLVCPLLIEFGVVNLSDLPFGCVGGGERLFLVSRWVVVVRRYVSDRKYVAGFVVEGFI